jgi:23S rRNA (uracil1939-C5)-methyltransferase
MKTERVEIGEIGHQGDGVAATPAGRVFVSYALPGEEVEIAPEGERARLVGILRESPERIAPVCEYFGTCGGCALQHWRAESYRDWKRTLVVDALAREKVETEVAALIDAHGKGRRRAVLHARRGGASEIKVGFAGRRSHAIVPIDACPVLAPPLARVFAIGRRAAEILAPKEKPLDLHFTATEGGLDLDVRGSGAIGEKLTTALARLAGDEKLARITRHGEPVVQLNEPALTIGRARVLLPPGAFLQATQAGEEALAKLVLEAAGKAKKVVDLFCGVGTFALRLAASAKILAVDSDAPAMAALARATKAPGLKPVEMLTRDLFRRPLVAVELKGCDAVVLDPPRQGAEAQARELAGSKIEKVIYVSCSPATFARDARILVSGGYRLVRVTPVDQFRYSAHVELVGIFHRKKLSWPGWSRPSTSFRNHDK